MKYFPRVVRYLYPYWKLVIVLVTLIVFNSLFTLLTPWPIKVLFDNVIGDRPLPSGLTSLLGPLAGDRTHLLIFAAFSSLGIVVVQNGLKVLDSYVKVRIEQNMVLDFRGDLFQRAQRLSLSYHDERRAGMVIYSINYHADSAAQTVMVIPPLVQSIITLVGMVWITLRIDRTLALLSLTVVPLLYYAVGYYIKHIQDRLWQVKMMEGESLSIIHEAISMLRVIVAFGREGHEFRRFRTQGEAAVNARVKLTVRQTAFSLAVNTATATGTALILGFGAYFVLQHRITGGDLLVMLSYVAAIYHPLETISYTIGSLQDHFISLRVSYEQILDREPEIRDQPGATAAHAVRGEVTFEGVSFAYNGREGTLNAVSFATHAGQVIGIVGPTGAGKTTLTSLIPRFYDAKRGRILLDGIDIRTITLASLRQQISVVPQEALLFSDSIADNIRYGRLDATMDDIIAAAKAANAHDFIMRLPDQYDTTIGERGAQLSGGERQRIAVARAFLKDAPILILDEPTSAIDAKTEAIILDALERLMAGRTTFFITHRLATIRHADMILVLDQGEIVEQGTHHELLARDGLYKQLHESQIRRERQSAPLPATGSESDHSIPPRHDVATVGAAEVASLPPSGPEPARSPVPTLPSTEEPALAMIPVLRKPKIVLLGMMSRIPVPGVIWQTIHYLIGFRRLGYDVYYVEAHARAPSMLMEHPADDASAHAAAFIANIMRRLDLGDRWAFHALHADGRYYGMSEARVQSLYQSAAAIINLHGGTKPRPEHYATDRLIYVETDPVALQIELEEGRQESIDCLTQHCALFTFGENLGNADCRLPVSDRFRFRPTRQPVIVDLWYPYRAGPADTFTTVGNWRQTWREVVYRGEQYYWSKHYEFLKFLDLPGRARQPFELALSSGSYDEAEKQLLEGRGWKVRDALDFHLDPDAYRQYIARSRGEFTVAKDQNVRLRSGWFSDRSATYLAAGRPVITQETGFSNVLPTGDGLFAFSTMDEIEAALDSIDADYSKHCQAAYAIAREYFNYDVVLPPLLAELGITSHTPRVPAKNIPDAASLVASVSDTRAESSRALLSDVEPTHPFPSDLLLIPTSRWPVTLSEQTVETVHAAAIPSVLSGYDIVWCHSDEAPPRWIPTLMEHYARHGHRVFSVTLGTSVLSGADTSSLHDRSPYLREICLPFVPPDGMASGRCDVSLDALEALRRTYGIETAILWIHPPSSPNIAHHARDRWGWKTLYLCTTHGVLGEVASPSGDIPTLAARVNWIVEATESSYRDSALGGKYIGVRPDDPPATQRAQIDAAVRTGFVPISIVIVTCNNLVFTKLCIASVLANTEYPAYEIIVVDNGSTDGTDAYVRALARQHAHVHVVAHADNLGFARAVNQGLAIANGDIVVLLNNDTVVPHGWLTRMARYLDDPTIGMVGPVTNHAGNEAQISVPYHRYGELVRFARERMQNYEAACTDVQMLTMFCVAMRRDVYREIGPLDERYEIGMFEDDDYAMRLRDAGYSIVCAEDVFVHHAGQATLSTWSATGSYGALFQSNRRRFDEKWGTQWQPHAHRQDQQYGQLVREIRAVIRDTISPDATVLVVSKGDDALLVFDGRHGWHFPQNDEGVFAGYYPADSSEAIAHLESLRDRGADFLLFPKTSLWWLEYYDRFAEHLDKHYHTIVDDQEIGRLYALKQPTDFRTQMLPGGANVAAASGSGLSDG